MRIPLLRFGSDMRPFEPWEYRYRWVIRAVVTTAVILWAMTMVCLLVVFVLVDSFARAFLPARLRPQLRQRYWHFGAQNPKICPVCGAVLVVRPIRIPAFPTGGEPADHVRYEGTCSGCTRTFQWVNLGTVIPGLDEIRDGVYVGSHRAT